ncbi:MAG: ArsR/SmtB family transcription factor [Sporichthyaceae bacterium]
MVVELMPRLDGPTADRMFHALADATRRDIVARTLHAEFTVSDLARLYPMSFAAVQKHVSVLTAAGLVTKERAGRTQIVRGNTAGLARTRALLDQVEQLWRVRLDQLSTLLDDLAMPRCASATAGELGSETTNDDHLEPRPGGTP